MSQYSLVTLMTETTEQLQNQFNQMRMSETAQALPGLLRQAEQHSWTYQEFLTVLLDHEVRRREEKMIEKYLKWARFPYEKSLDVFDVQAQKSLSQRQLTQLREMGWMNQMFNLILLGPPGVGKTHLAIGLGIEAIHKGKRVSFITMGELVSLLKTEEYVRRSQLQLKRIRAAELLIIDDLMFMAMAPFEANLFFQLVNHLHTRSSIILTSNKGPDQWGELMGDEGITTAILDRLLHQAEVIHLSGDSHRLKNRKTIF